VEADRLQVVLEGTGESRVARVRQQDVAEDLVQETLLAAMASYERFVQESARLGIEEPRHLDLMTALFSGLASQQVANDPGGDRWRRLGREAVEMYVTHVMQERSQT
jgi:hypothetical protein